jgi:hypothetical protein
MKRVLSITRSPTYPLRERIVHPRDPFGRRRPPRIDLRKACACDGVDVDMSSTDPLAAAAPADPAAPVSAALGGDVDCVCACDTGFAAVDGRAGVDDGAVVNAALGDASAQDGPALGETAVDATVAAQPLAGADVAPPPSSTPAPVAAGPADGAVQ